MKWHQTSVNVPEAFRISAWHRSHEGSPSAVPCKACILPGLFLGSWACSACGPECSAQKGAGGGEGCGHALGRLGYGTEPNASALRHSQWDLLCTIVDFTGHFIV